MTDKDTTRRVAQVLGWEPTAEDWAALTAAVRQTTPAGAGAARPGDVGVRVVRQLRQLRWMVALDLVLNAVVLWTLLST